MQVVSRTPRRAPRPPGGLGAGPVHGGDGHDATSDASAAFVVGDAAALGTDASVVDRMRARGYTVSLHDDNSVTAAICGQCLGRSGHRKASAWRSWVRSCAMSPRPMVIWKPSIYDDMGMSPTAGASLSRTQHAAVGSTRPQPAADAEGRRCRPVTRPRPAGRRRPSPRRARPGRRRGRVEHRARELPRVQLMAERAHSIEALGEAVGVLDRRLVAVLEVGDAVGALGGGDGRRFHGPQYERGV